MEKNIFSNSIALIPARFQSSRFPGKPLALILGKSLIQRTYESSLQCKELEAVSVATDDEKVLSHVQSFGGSAYLTSPQCSNGTERIAEVVRSQPELKNATIIVNIQGDHPCIEPETIQATLNALKRDPLAVMATAAGEIRKEEDFISPHVVKCIFDLQGNALYFSRSPLPYFKSLQGSFGYHHIGVYAYRREFLLAYAAMRETPLQKAEDLEQLKILEHGFRIKVALVKEYPLNVDIPEDIAKVEEYLCR